MALVFKARRPHLPLQKQILPATRSIEVGTMRTIMMTCDALIAGLYLGLREFLTQRPRYVSAPDTERC